MRNMNRHHLFSVIFLFFLLVGSNLPAQDGQTRALWVTRWDYQSSDDIKQIMRNASAYHFNTILFQVRGTGTVAYPSNLEPWSAEFNHSDPGWDPLQLALELAHGYDMELHAWINVYPGWGGKQAPEDPNQLYNSHKDWFMTDQAGNPQALNSHYVWLSPTHPLVQKHILNLCREIYSRYNIDGIHLDYFRYPGPGFSYDPASIKIFQFKTGHTPDEVPYTWNKWRRNNISLLLAKLHRALKEHNPEMILSASVVGNYSRGYNMFFQDSHGWLANNIVDAVYPMVYTSDSLLFRNWTTQHLFNTHDRHIYPGILINSPDQMADQIRISNTLNTKGLALFSYGKLFPSHFPDPVYTQKLEAAFGPSTRPASLPWKAYAGDSQGPVISEIKTIPASLDDHTKFKIAAYITDPSGVYDDKTGPEGQGIYLIFDRQWPPKEGQQYKMSRVKKSDNWYITDKSIPPQSIGLDFRCRIFAWDDYHESANHPKRNLGYSDIWSFSILKTDDHYISKGKWGPSLWRPTSLAIDTQQNIWIGGISENPVTVLQQNGEPASFSPITEALNEYGNPLQLQSVSCLTYSGNGYIYALDSDNPGLILRFFTRNGIADTAWVTDYPASALDCDDQGNIYLLESRTAKWHVLNKQGVELKNSPFGQGHYGHDIAVLRDGSAVFINDLSTNSVQQWNGAVEGEYARFWQSDDLPAVDLDVGRITSKSNFVYVSHSQRGIITIYSRAGYPVTHLTGGTPPLYAPMDIAISKDGSTLYVLEAPGNGPSQLIKWSKQAGN